MLDPQLSRKELAERWNCSLRKVDRLRKLGRLPWLDLTGGTGRKPFVRFRLKDILAFEETHLMSISISDRDQR